MLGLSKDEEKILKALKTPAKVQDFLDGLEFNFEESGEGLMSPRRVLKAGKAHCLEGALLAAAALWLQGREPSLMDFKTVPSDEEHVVALFKEGKFWGAISKTNHGVLRYRDAIYASPRELALSYFHEYFDFKTGEKTLRSFSKPFSLKKFGEAWVTAEEDLWWIDKKLDAHGHVKILSPAQIKKLRPAGPTEIRMGKVIEWEH